MIQNALGKRTEAADNLLAIVKADRTWRDDGARAATAAVLRRLGHDRRGDAGEPAQTVVDPVLVDASRMERRWSAIASACKTAFARLGSHDVRRP